MATIAYSDIINVTAYFAACWEDVPDDKYTGTSISSNKITASHVLINDSFQPIVNSDVEWTTTDGSLTITFTDGMRNLEQVWIVFYLGIPINS